MPNFGLSHKRVKVLACMADPWRSRVRTPRPGFEANAPRSGPRTAGFPNEVLAEPREAHPPCQAREAPGRGPTGVLGDETLHGIGGFPPAAFCGHRRPFARRGARGR